MTTSRLFVISSIILAILLARMWDRREVLHPPGVLVGEAPEQTGIVESSFERDGFRFTRRARFDLSARVLGSQRYYLGTEASLSPVDLALGWGPMSDQVVLDQIGISQSARWYHLDWGLSAPIPEPDIMNHSSNMHMIPAENWVANILKDVRKGQVVTLRGYLVDVDGPADWTWRTSMSRDDRGLGACEIVFVEYISAD